MKADFLYGNPEALGAGTTTESREGYWPPAQDRSSAKASITWS
jgi:hypothetical protein